MRKFTLIFILLAFANYLTAQDRVIKQHALKPMEKKSPKVKTVPAKSTRTAIWSEDFDGGLPDGWTIVDLSDENMPWAWTNEAILGCYTNIQPGDVASLTPENGYMHINPCGFNSIPQYSNGEGVEARPDEAEVIMDSYFQSPPIDLSSVDGAILEFYQYVRVFYDFSSAIWVSSDYDPANPDNAHWTEYLTQDMPYNWSIEEFYQINISEVAAGKENVYIRVYGYGATQYFWIIDDMKIIEPYDNNMQVNDSWLLYDWFEEDPIVTGYNTSGYMQHGGGYYKIPKDQVRPFVGSQAAAENFGSFAQTNVKLKTEFYWKADSSANDSTLVHSIESEGTPYEAFYYDSISNETSYTPADWGHYEVYMSVEMDNADDLPIDNVAHTDFEISDSTFSRTTDNVNSTASTRDWIGGGIDGDGLGQFYRLHKPVTEVSGFRWYFAKSNKTHADLINGGNWTALAKIFGYNEVEEDWEISPIVSSNVWTASMADTGTWITLDYVGDGSNEFLPAGDYMIFLETYTSVDDGPEHNIRFLVGEDIERKQPDYAQLLWAENSWGWVDATNTSFSLKVKAEDWDTASSVTDPVAVEHKKIQLGQNYPNPAIHETEIKYVISNLADVYLSIYDLTGKQILYLEEGIKSSGRHSIELDITDLESGVYYYTLRAGQYESTRKMVVMD